VGVPNYATFKPLVDSTFKVKLAEPIPELEGMDLGPAELSLVLIEATANDDERCERFSLIFHGPPDRLLPQKLYSLRHDTMGELQLFLVPVGEKAEGVGENRRRVGYRYQAVFNRLKQQR
jgi:hypothetical protein